MKIEAISDKVLPRRIIFFTLAPIYKNAIYKSFQRVMIEN